MVDHYSRPGSALAAVIFGVTWAVMQLFTALGPGVMPELLLLALALLLAIGSLLLFIGVTRWVYVVVVVAELVLSLAYSYATSAYDWVVVMTIGPAVGLVFALVPATTRWLPRGR
nr:hypothetical protein [Kibdelosporangium sp. MJ126-NF4]CEL17138.1 hypothetical protein [Kibdelosporangium sp. MJ126-NF4]CTQ91633.1 hypothetical protein [Kibdelosporangium sp. MJ126-NF4]